MSRLRGAVLLLAALFLPVVALAAETGSQPVWYGNVQLWEILATVVVAVWTVVKAKYHLDEKWDSELMGFLEHGARVAYDTFVREAKAKAPDGKLTQAQITEAREVAFNAAKELAKQKGIDLAKRVAAEKVPLLINKVVARLKNK